MNTDVKSKAKFVLLEAIALLQTMMTCNHVLTELIFPQTFHLIYICSLYTLSMMLSNRLTILVAVDSNII